ncbi:Ankyrin repeat protein [compost metagenome]
MLIAKGFTGETCINSHGNDFEHTILGWTALHIACNDGLIEVANELLKDGADINARSDDGKTALIRAVIHKQENVVSFLLSQGADPYIKDKEGKTASDYKAAWGDKLGEAANH